MSTRVHGMTAGLSRWITSRHDKGVGGSDPMIYLATFLLALIGVIMVFSASAVVAEDRFHDAGYFLKRQLAWVIGGLVLLHLASRIDYEVWRRAALPGLSVCVLLLVLVLVPMFGTEVNGARRWFRVGPVSVQPSEIAKVAIIFYLAAYLARKEHRLSEFGRGVLPPLIIVGGVAALLLAQPDLGTAVVLGIVAWTLLYLAGARLVHLMGLMAAALPVGAMLLLSAEYRRARVLSFLDPWEHQMTSGYQLVQSFLALGNGGVAGVGLGEGKQKLFFLPEAHADFVLALIGEELGLVGTTVILLLFVGLVVRGCLVAAGTQDRFGYYLALGITLLVGTQALINACVVTGLLPTKGLTLPFVSYGGSSMMMSLFAIGVLMNISRDRRAECRRSRAR